MDVLQFTIQPPKGGRQEQKVVMREDELLQLKRNKKKKKQDLFDEDFSSFLAPRKLQDHNVVVGGRERRNMNESRHRTGKRKKKQGTLN